MTDQTCQPFKPDTWPVDADGFAADLCTECGTPVRYGSRHTDCGRKALGLPTVADARAALKPAVYAGPAPAPRLKWMEAPRRTEWGAGMMEALIALGPDETLRLYADRDAVPTVNALLEKLGLDKPT